MFKLNFGNIIHLNFLYGFCFTIDLVPFSSKCTADSLE